MTTTPDTAPEAPSVDADGLNPSPEGVPTGGTPPEAPGGAESPEHSGSKLHREAARYRTQLRDTEAERDALAGTLAQLQQRELHRLAGEHLSNPEDIDLAGNELSHYLTPEGWVDHDAVAEAAAAVVSSRPGLAKNAPAVDPSQGHGGSGGRSKVAWSDLLKS